MQLVYIYIITFSQKIRCPNSPCTFSGSFKDLKNHLCNECPYLDYKCEFCKCKVHRAQFESHLDEHYKSKTFNIVNCIKCESSENLCRCLCKKTICMKCLQSGKNPGILYIITLYRMY